MAAGRRSVVVEKARVGGTKQNTHIESLKVCAVKKIKNFSA
jgi:hypothetical protein